MCRFELKATAFLLLSSYYYVTIRAISTDDDDTTKNSFETYDPTNSDDIAHESMKHTLTAYHDYILTQSKENYVPDTSDTVKKSDQDQQFKNDHDQQISKKAQVIVDEEEIDNLQQTSTIPSSLLTTIDLEVNTSDILNDLAIVDNKDADEQNDSVIILDTDHSPVINNNNKHGKMFALPSFNSDDIHIMDVYGENKIQSESLTMKNDTDDDEYDAEDTDNFVRTTNYPITTQIMPKKSTILPATITTTTTATTLTTTTVLDSTTTTEAINNIATSTLPTTTFPTTTPRRKPTTVRSTRVYKFSANEILRKFLEDSFIRAPLAALIDTSADSLQKSKRLWKAALRPNAAIDIVLVTYNSSGVGVTYSFKNTRTMEAGLDSIKESSEQEIGGNAFYGIVRASELVPYDSAIFISTDKVPLDTNLAQYAAITLLKKRIRLYLIWFGADNNETQGQNTNGGILGEVALRSGGEILRITEDTSGKNGDLGLITLYLRNDIHGVNALDIPVEIPINYHNSVETATLDSIINDEFPDIYIYWENFPRRQRRMTDEKNSTIFDNVDMFGSRHFQFPTEKESIEFENETIPSIEIMGRTVVQESTTIEIGSQSQLMATPGSTIQIYYEVTNLREVPTFHVFRVVDEKRFLRTLNPQSVWIGSQQTITAVVSAYIPPNIEIGIKDKITFSSQGFSSVSQSATITVSTSTASLDRRQPDIYWNFGSRCFYKNEAGQCANSVWSVELTAIDRESGLLRIQSVPRGIIVRSQFDAGTTEEVRATYTASCCSPKVTITVFDVAGNQRSVIIDVNDFYLDAAGIAAVVLGVILLILLIALIIWLIVWCCRRKESHELPVYRSRAEREGPRVQ